MLNEKEEINLRKLAKVFDNLNQEQSKGYLTDTFFMTSCYQPDFLKKILKNITSALLLENENPNACQNAKKACSLFIKLYKNDPRFKDSLIKAWSGDLIIISNFEKNYNLEEILIGNRIYKELSEPQIIDEALTKNGNMIISKAVSSMLKNDIHQQKLPKNILSSSNEPGSSTLNSKDNLLGSKMKAGEACIKIRNNGQLRISNMKFSGSSEINFQNSKLSLTQNDKSNTYYGKQVDFLGNRLLIDGKTVDQVSILNQSDEAELKKASLNQPLLIKAVINVEYGDALFISGQHSYLGQWEKAIRLRYTKDNIWVTDLPLDAIGSEFKFLVGSYNAGMNPFVTALIWEDNTNRKVASTHYYLDLHSFPNKFNLTL